MERLPHSGVNIWLLQMDKMRHVSVELCLDLPDGISPPSMCLCVIIHYDPA